MAEAALQVLLCDRQGQSYAVGVEEIASIERDRSALYRTLLVDRATGLRIAVDRVGGVTEVDRAALSAPPRRLGAASQGLLGLLAMEGTSVPLVTARFLAGTGAIEMQPEAVSRIPSSDLAARAETPQLLISALRVAEGTGPGPEVVVGIPLEQVLDVTEPLPWVPLSVTGGWVRGLLAWRGRTAQVVDLARCFGLEPRRGADEERVVIVRGTGRAEPLAFMAPAALQRVSPSRSVAVPAEEAGLRGAAIRGVFRWTGRLLVVPDFDALL